MQAFYLHCKGKTQYISIGGTDMHVPAISVFTRLSFGMFKDTPLLEARQECVEAVEHSAFETLSQFAEVSPCCWTVATRCESRLLHVRVQCSAALSQRVRAPTQRMPCIEQPATVQVPTKHGMHGKRNQTTALSLHCRVEMCKVWDVPFRGHVATMCPSRSLPAGSVGLLKKSVKSFASVEFQSL